MVEAWDEAGREVAQRYFVREGDALCTRLPLMLSMLTLDSEVIRQDCLCYLMERIDLPQPVMQD